MREGRSETMVGLTLPELEAIEQLSDDDIYELYVELSKELNLAVASKVNKSERRRAVAKEASQVLESFAKADTVRANLSIAQKQVDALFLLQHVLIWQGKQGATQVAVMQWRSRKTRAKLEYLEEAIFLTSHTFSFVCMDASRTFVFV